jgi:hypothetical protein
VGEEVQCAIDKVIEEDDKTKSIKFIKNRMPRGTMSLLGQFCGAERYWAGTSGV